MRIIVNCRTAGPEENSMKRNSCYILIPTVCQALNEDPPAVVSSKSPANFIRQLLLTLCTDEKTKVLRSNEPLAGRMVNTAVKPVLLPLVCVSRKLPEMEFRRNTNFTHQEGGFT